MAKNKNSKDDDQQAERARRQAEAAERYEKAMREARKRERESSQEGPYDDSKHVQD